MATRRPLGDKLIREAIPERNVTRAAVGAVVAGGALSAAKLGFDRRASRENARRFRLGEGEPVSEGLVRIAFGQIDTASQHLEKGSEESVHEARKSFKRLRAVVRLARDELGDEAYRRENRELRDLGRRLSGARDGQVLVETLEALPEAPRGLRESLVAEHAAAERELTGGGVPEDAVRDLRQVRARVADWPLQHDGLESLTPGFRRIYRRARRAYRRAHKDPSAENLHELRKRTKDLWYSAQILRPAAPKRMKRLSRRAHDLSDLIGEEHDLAILAERVSDGPAVGDLTDLIERRRAALRRQLFPLGRRLFRKKPRKVARLLERAPA